MQKELTPGKSYFGNTIERFYPMHVLRLQTVLELEKLTPHQELKAQNLVQEYDPATMGPVLFVSHQWTSFRAPDHTNAQLHTLQGVVRRMQAGKLPVITNSYSGFILGSHANMSRRSWKELVSREPVVWIDYCSFPQPSAGR
eukprot:3984234-Prymnesium_polylepis.1